MHAGEVLGVTGLLGDGRSELFQSVFGAMGKSYTGKVTLGGREVHITNTYQALEEGSPIFRATARKRDTQGHEHHRQWLHR